MNGTFFGVSVGPGDPELLTLKAVRILRQADLLAIPVASEGGRSVAWEIARQAVPALADKPTLPLLLPMTRDAAMLERTQREAAEQVMAALASGETVAMPTLGDVSVYSTALYLHERIVAAGFCGELVAGVPSFCAAGAKLGTGLVRAHQPLHILPGSYGQVEQGLDWPGVKVLMKTGRSLPNLRELLARRGLLERARMVERCGMPGERIYPSLAEADAQADYFSIILVEE